MTLLSIPEKNLDEGMNVIKAIKSAQYSYYDSRFLETKMILRRDLMGKLHHLGLGTAQVEQWASKMDNGSSHSKINFLHIKNEMKSRLIDAAFLKNKQKKIRIYEEQRLRGLVDERSFRRFKSIANKFCYKLWTITSKRYVKKVNHLTNKFRPTKTKEEYFSFGNIKIMDKDMKDREILELFKVGVETDNNKNTSMEINKTKQNKDNSQTDMEQSGKSTFISDIINKIIDAVYNESETNPNIDILPNPAFNKTEKPIEFLPNTASNKTEKPKPIDILPNPASDKTEKPKSIDILPNPASDKTDKAKPSTNKNKLNALQISKNIESLGEHGPNFRTYKKVDPFRVEIKCEKLRVQMRRVELQHKKDKEDKDNIDDILVDGKPLEPNEGDMAKPFDRDHSIMNLANLKAHHFDINSRTIAPPPMSNQKERDAATLIDTVIKTTKDFIKEKEDKKVPLEFNNLNSEKRQGIKDSKALKGLVHFTQTDKTKKLAIMSNEMYDKAMEKNKDDTDKQIDEKELRKLERENNGIARSVLRIFEAGLNSYDETQVGRLIETLESTNKSASSLSLLPKDHQAPDNEGNYKTRTVWNVQDTPGENAGKLLSKILDSVCDTSKIMIKSGEEAMAFFKEYNLEQKRGNTEDDKLGQRWIGSLDANKLYNMISPKTAEVNVRQSVIESLWEMEVNVKELKVFLATNMDNEDTKNENFEEIIPRRRSNKGISPTLLGKEMNARPKTQGSEAFVLNPKGTKKPKLNSTIKDDQAINTVDQELMIELDNKKMELNKLAIQSSNKLRHLAIGELKKNRDLDGLKSFAGSSDLNLRRKTLIKETHKDLEKRNSAVDMIKDNLNNFGANQADTAVDATTKNKKEDIIDETRKKVKISSWAKAEREPTALEIKRMVGWMMGIAVRKILENHCYEVNGEIFQIMDKGSIGFDLQRCISNIVTERHGRKVLELTGQIYENTDPSLEADLRMDLYKTYVDDTITELKEVPDGAVYDSKNKKIVIDQAKKIEDVNSNLGKDKKAFNLLTEIVNTIDPEIIMKNEVPSDHPELGFAVPFLDTAVWIEEADANYPKGKILHRYFEKPMNAQIVIHKDSAMNERAKRTTHTQQIIRVLRNTSRELPDDQREIGVNQYVQKLYNSGYDERYRQEVVIAAYKGYKKQCEDEDKGFKPLYRPWSWNRDERDKAKEEKPRSWFQKGGWEHKLFVPATQNGELKAKIEEAIKEVNQRTKVKIIEESGVPLLDVLRNATTSSDNPPCSDMDNCLLCSNGQLGICRRSHVLYKMECLGTVEEKEKGENEDGENSPEICGGLYNGESNRNGFTRGSEHLADSKIHTVEGVENSVILKHAWQCHDGEDIKVKMKIVGSFRGDPTGRQVAEAILIRNTPESISMNSKAEYVQPCDVKEKYESAGGSWILKKKEKLLKKEKEALRIKVLERYGKEALPKTGKKKRDPFNDVKNMITAATKDENNKHSKKEEDKSELKIKANIDVQMEYNNKQTNTCILNKNIVINEAMPTSNKATTSTNLSHPVTEKTVPSAKSKKQNKMIKDKLNHPNLKQPTISFIKINKVASQHQKDETLSKLNEKIKHHRSISQSTGPGSKKKARKVK